MQREAEQARIKRLIYCERERYKGMGIMSYGSIYLLCPHNCSDCAADGDGGAVKVRGKWLMQSSF